MIWSKILCCHATVYILYFQLRYDEIYLMYMHAILGISSFWNSKRVRSWNTTKTYCSIDGGTVSDLQKCSKFFSLFLSSSIIFFAIDKAYKTLELMTRPSIQILANRLFFVTQMAWIVYLLMTMMQHMDNKNDENSTVKKDDQIKTNWSIRFRKANQKICSIPNHNSDTRIWHLHNRFIDT